VHRPIQILSSQLANQIAAGEVVERPASVVKELLENSIDAGATQIELVVEQGGLRLIRVLDDGHGIPHEQLPLAVMPHATSKLYSQQELEQIASLGFRGEALASIASVSRFRLASRFSDAEEGWEFSCDGNHCTEPVPSALPGGTQIEVRDLFHSIPARRKFLRSERTEFLHIEEVVRRLALSRFDIAFTLQHNGRQVLRLRRAEDPAEQARRVGEVLGRGFINGARGVQFEAAGLRLHGWMASPQASRSQADSQYFYLNGRMIRDRLIQHALRQAHQGLLEEGRHPAFVLALEIDPRQVDVNVHPTKHEVRFREPRLVHDFIQRALRDTLRGDTGGVVKADSYNRVNHRGKDAVVEQEAFYRQAVRSDESSAQDARLILFRRYLLAVGGDGPQLLDIVAAHRQLLVNHLQNVLDGAEVRSQPLLIPKSAAVGVVEAERVLSAVTAFAAIGFELDRLGEETLVLRRIPAQLRGADSAELLRLLQQQAGEPLDRSFLEALSALVPPPVESLAATQGLMRQLEALPDKGSEFWCSLNLDALQKLFESGER
jgi:DNA mismatch repair protein MutL